MFPALFALFVFFFFIFTSNTKFTDDSQIIVFIVSTLACFLVLVDSSPFCTLHSVTIPAQPHKRKLYMNTVYMIKFKIKTQ